MCRMKVLKKNLRRLPNSRPLMRGDFLLGLLMDVRGRMKAVKDQSNTLESLKDTDLKPEDQDTITLVVPDNAMSPRLLKDDVVTVKLNEQVTSSDYVLIRWQNGYLVRRLIIRFEVVVFVAERSGVPDIIVPVSAAKGHVVGRVVRLARNFE